MYAFITLIREAQYARFGSAPRVQSSADDAGLFTCTCHFVLAVQAPSRDGWIRECFRCPISRYGFAAAVVSSAADDGWTWPVPWRPWRLGKSQRWTRSAEIPCPVNNSRLMRRRSGRGMKTAGNGVYLR
jgi:hypothetical protein